MATVFPLINNLKRSLVMMMAFSLSACTSLFFYPTKDRYHSLEKLGLVHEDVFIESADETKLHAWLLKTTQTRKGVIYFLHGNAENISSHVASVYWLPEQGYDVFLLDYRGFGHSEGDPSLPEVFDDIESGFAGLDARYSKQEPVFFLGQSLGAALGTYWIAHSPLAQQRLQAIALDAPFSSYSGMVEDVLQRSWLTWLFAKPVSWCFRGRYDPERAAKLLPKDKAYLFFASREDKVVPFDEGEALYEALPKNKRRIVTQGAHIATFNFPDNRDQLLQFLQQ